MMPAGPAPMMTCFMGLVFPAFAVQKWGQIYFPTVQNWGQIYFLVVEK
jgi:hypothetical protein